MSTGSSAMIVQQYRVRHQCPHPTPFSIACLTRISDVVAQPQAPAPWPSPSMVHRPSWHQTSSGGNGHSNFPKGWTLGTYGVFSPPRSSPEAWLPTPGKALATEVTA